MTDKEALLEALEALHYCEALNRNVDERKMQAITVIRKLWTEHAMREVQRLGQEIEQEPVAWLSTDSIGERHLCFDKPLDNDPVQPLYTAPPQPEQEPVADDIASILACRDMLDAQPVPPRENT